MLELEEKVKNLAKLFSGSPEILTVFLFGSYGTSNQTDLSDIDFAVLFDKRIDISKEAAYLDDLTRFLGTDRVDLVNLNRASLNLQFKAISEGNISVTFYCKKCSLYGLTCKKRRMIFLYAILLFDKFLYQCIV
ncbi:type VII toxin-antitoxin system MntA family adenylyltransferase antitoxin [Phosphitispora sp. TUW77]|uniref:type VII toxin-antitoxin system MntA family adenylyltransferase antitoxin n=1 Tax=Phosphitispora sp. TUW77 TaxID=3152361 RepID=UPI003AB7647A